MAAKRRVQKKLSKVGPRGPRGRRGPAGAPANEEIAELAAQMEHVTRQLHIQLSRIAQIQAQLDRLASGQAPVMYESSTPKRIDS